VVLRTRQHLAAVMVHGKALVLVLLRFADELRDASDLELPDGNLKNLGITPEELSMAEKLVEGMVGDWKPEKYEDDYRHDLMKLIERKAKAGEINTVSEVEEKAPRRKTSGKVIDLAALLAESLAKGSTQRSVRPGTTTRARTRTDAEGKHRPAARRSEGHRKSA
jgi:DNA end-binding protein Ku